MICVVNGRYKIRAETLRGILAEKQPDESLESAIERVAWGMDGFAKAENRLPSNVAEAARPRRKRVRAASAPPLSGWTETRTVARHCRCGQALYGKYRFCDDCRTIRNRETARIRKRRSRDVTKNRLSHP
jgi:hypothetical protein